MRAIHPALIALSVLWTHALAEDCGETRRVGVSIINLAQAPAGIVREAREECSRIFHRAGVDIDWDLPADPGTRQLTMIISSALSRNAPPHAVGYVVSSPSGPAGVVVWPRVTSFIAPSTPAFEVLGRVLAHEIGHLLLPDEGHSDVGLMRAVWRPQDLRADSASEFFLTSIQGNEMRCELTRADKETR